MRVQVEILPWLSEHVSVGHRGRLTLTKEVSDGITVREFLETLVSDNQPLRGLIFVDSGRLAGYILLLLNGRLIELAGGMEAKLRPGDTLRLMPGYSGG